MIHFFYSLITFIIALFFVMVGLLGLMIQFSTNIRAEVVGFIYEDTLFLSLFSLASLLIGIAIVFSLLASFKKRYIKIKSKNNHAFYLDESLFQDYMKSYWNQLFPKQDIPNHVVLKKNKVLITADLPYIPEAQQKALLTRIDQDLKEMFTHLLGYRQEYVISISFQNEAVTAPS
jgi:hypothetical protein